MPSTVIRAFFYDAANGELSVVFRSGRRYVYRGVPETVYQRMRAAFSKGEFFNLHVRDRYRFVRSDAAE